MKTFPAFKVQKAKGSWIQITGKDKEGKDFIYKINGVYNSAKKLRDLFYEIYKSVQDQGVLLNILKHDLRKYRSVEFI
jgi:hypothetical protein